MSEHSSPNQRYNEPWQFVAKDTAAGVYTSKTTPVVTERYPLDYQRDRMRRIVAAVNACEGISTDALEDGAVSELLEALRDLAEVVDPEGTGEVEGYFWPPLQKASEAIAKATGEG